MPERFDLLMERIDRTNWIGGASDWYNLYGNLWHQLGGMTGLASVLLKEQKGYCLSATIDEEEYWYA